MTKKHFVILGFATLAFGAMVWFGQLSSAQAADTCLAQPVSLNAEPLELDNTDQTVKFTYQATTDCTDRSQISFIIRASSNFFANDFYTAKKLTIPSSAFKRYQSTNFYTADGSVSFAPFQISPTSLSRGFKGCVQFKSETINCDEGMIKLNVKQATTGGGSGTGGGTGTGTGGSPGTVSDVPDYDKIIGRFENPLQANSIPELLVRLMRILLGLVATVAIVVIIVSGFRMVLSQGNPQALTKAKSAITWAILGLIVSLMAFSIIAILQRLIQTR